MKFPPSFLEEIKARLPVSEVVRRRVKLQKAGREWKGLSPFNSEKTPSFFVNDQKQAWFDFSSGRNGSVFDFLMLTEGVSFPEAVERLASMAGLQLPQESPESAEREKKRAGLQEVLELAAKFFEEQLQGRAGAKARGYLADRGLPPAIQQEFRLGYAPGERFALREWLADRGATVETMIEAGLLIHGEDIAVPYDRFRDRVMFPIQDRSGRVIAFGGRALEKDVQAKYLNSPETPLFHKGAQLYNHHRARKAAHDRGTVIAVEGYVDVIALAMAGFPHAVAPLGTALTPDQCGLLWRMAEEPILCFDGDRAGRKAAHRAIDTALPLIGPGRTFRFALLPEGQDPDDLVRNKGAAAMGEALDGAMPMAELLWQREVEAAPLDTPERRAALERRIADVLKTIADESLRRHYRDDMDRRLGVLFGRAAPGQARSQRGVGAGAWRPRRAQFSGRGGAYRAEPRLGYITDPLPPGGLAATALIQNHAPMPAREAVILLALIRSPALIDRHLEELAALDFAGRDTARLLSGLLALAGAEDWEAEALRAALAETGFGEALERMERSAAVAPLGAALARGAPADAAEVLRQAMGLHHKAVALHRELRSAELALGNDANEANFMRLREIQVELANLEATQAAAEGAGQSSGMVFSGL